MKSMLYAAGLAAGLVLSWGAYAQDRYVEPPPVLVSPDLSAPWVMQLRSAPVRVQQERRQQAQQYRAYQDARRTTSYPRVQQDYTPHARRTVTVQPGQAQVQPAAYGAMPSDRSWNMSDPKWLPQVVDYSGKHGAGTVIVDTQQRFLFLVMKDGKARRYGVGVGKEGFGWNGTEKITQKREWPDWRPPAEMIAREKAKGRVLPAHMKGGPANPLGARALYLGSTLYRIHGTNAPWTIGRAVSSGCIRMRNEDVMDLYNRVGVGTKVVVM
ncbi:ErfK/YbiS/YcfS/YnhG protein [Nitratireductor indicus C115]|uniref:ErfK/YbiS/YcfS/YnhG protein n=1 Tax=Nitratireductor indicus C115 TaxID=1231190 RepID=K2PJ41_9HYPH|nr:L,D-transpeptidase [Nitratireductor indicus]EKF41152.1 ErfK/YbiS/YcfS/YnhG protein [Nitratireductor indicus C115]SFQ64233.1 Lipoprotein-anchoring transpeptidase ErfK/SrfK [Nitratireductor indicus]